ncbi:MAG: nitrilase-related carbon-nitrogen hydrolase, partial [Maribacter sp.]
MKDKLLKIALIQSPLVWENPGENRIDFSKKIASLNREVDLVVLPEMFTTGFTMSPQNIDLTEGNKTLEWMLLEASNNNVAIVGSIVFYENGDYTNRLFFVEPNGKIQRYDKRHTFTLAGEDKIY